MTAIKCTNVSKSFSDTKVLNDVNLELEAGHIYALLGRNGAGKTTLMNCLCTKYLPDTGDIFLLEEKAYENEKVLKQICFMSDYIQVFASKKVKDILKFASCFYENWDNALMNKLLDFFSINRKMLYSALSKGMCTIVSIIIGLCSGCEIVLLDEIYSGLDAVARQQFYDILLKEQEKHPRTFILSTHLIEEMTGLFENVIMMDKGSILLKEDMETLYEKSYKCVGRTDQSDCLNGKNVIFQKQMGSITEYDIYDTFTAKEQKELEALGFSFSSLSLQELFIAFTAGSATEWGDTDGTN